MFLLLPLLCLVTLLPAAAIAGPPATASTSAPPRQTSPCLAPGRARRTRARSSAPRACYSAPAALPPRVGRPGPVPRRAHARDTPHGPRPASISDVPHGARSLPSAAACCIAVCYCCRLSSLPLPAIAALLLAPAAPCYLLSTTAALLLPTAAKAGHGHGHGRGVYVCRVCVVCVCGWLCHSRVWPCLLGSLISSRS